MKINGKLTKKNVSVMMIFMVVLVSILFVSCYTVEVNRRAQDFSEPTHEEIQQLLKSAGFAMYKEGYPFTLQVHQGRVDLRGF